MAGLGALGGAGSNLGFGSGNIYDFRDEIITGLPQGNHGDVMELSCESNLIFYECHFNMFKVLKFIFKTTYFVRRLFENLEMSNINVKKL